MSRREEYNKYIRSEEWRARKRQYYSRYKKQCRACKSKSQIHLHHVSYDNLGSEPDRDLCPLCKKCHNRVHAVQRRTKEDLRKVTAAYVRNPVMSDGSKAKPKRRQPRKRKRGKPTNYRPKRRT